MAVTLSAYPSPYFPVLLSWRTGTVEHTAVFPTEHAAVEYITARYGSVNIRES